MFKDTAAFSGFAVDDVDAARGFYADVLELDVTDVTEVPAGCCSTVRVGLMV